MDEQKPPNYVAWIVATAAGVIIGHYAIRQYQMHEATEMLKQITRESQQQSASIRAQAAQIQQRARAEAEIQRERLEIQVRDGRTGDATGTRLSRQCDEWTRTAEGMKKSDYALQEKTKFCGQFESYVKHGSLPRP